MTLFTVQKFVMAILVTLLTLLNVLTINEALAVRDGAWLAVPVCSCVKTEHGTASNLLNLVRSSDRYVPYYGRTSLRIVLVRYGTWYIGSIRYDMR